MLEQIASLRANSGHMLDTAAGLERAAATKRAHTSLRRHKFEWTQAAIKLADERREAEAATRAALRALAEGSGAGECARLVLDMTAQDNEREDLARGLAEQLAAVRHLQADALAPRARSTVGSEPGAGGLFETDPEAARQAARLARELVTDLEGHAARLGQQAECEELQLKAQCAALDVDPAAGGGVQAARAGAAASAANDVRRALEAEAAASLQGEAPGTDASPLLAPAHMSGKRAALAADPDLGTATAAPGDAVSANPSTLTAGGGKADPTRARMLSAFVSSFKRVDAELRSALARVREEYSDVLQALDPRPGGAGHGTGGDGGGAGGRHGGGGDESEETGGATARPAQHALAEGAEAAAESHGWPADAAGGGGGRRAGARPGQQADSGEYDDLVAPGLSGQQAGSGEYDELVAPGVAAADAPWPPPAPAAEAPAPEREGGAVTGAGAPPQSDPGALSPEGVEGALTPEGVEGDGLQGEAASAGLGELAGQGAHRLLGWPADEHNLVLQVCRAYSGKPRAALLERLRLQLPHRGAAEIAHFEDLARRERAYRERVRALHADAARESTRLAAEAQAALAAAQEAAQAEEVRGLDRAAHEERRARSHAHLDASRAAKEAMDRAMAEEERHRAEVEDAIAAAHAAAEAVERHKQKLALDARREALQEGRRVREAEEAAAQAAEAAVRAVAMRAAAQRAAFRAELLDQRREEGRQREAERAAEEADREARLQALAGSVRPHVEANPERVIQATAASAAAAAAAEEEAVGSVGGGGMPFRPVQGFRDDQVMSDMRHKIFNALVDAGLQHSEYGRKLVLAATPAVPAHLKSRVPNLGNAAHDLPSRWDGASY